MINKTWHFRHWWWGMILPLVVLIWPYFQTGVPYTHDGENHLARFANYKVAVREGQIPPRFAPNLMNHYGYPVFNYNYPLLNILSLPLSVLNVHYEITFKLLMTLGLVMGAVGINLWLKSYAFSRVSRWLAIGSYLLAPFTANLIYVRGNIGELWAMALFPWLLWLTSKLVADKKISWWLSVPLITTFLLSHNVSVLFGGLLWFLYSWHRLGKNKQLWLAWLKPSLLAVALSAWFWLPAMAEKSLIVLDETNLSQDFRQHFVEPGQLIFAPLEFGFSYLSRVDTLSFSVGLMTLMGLVISSLWLIKNFKLAATKKYRFLIIAGWLLLFFQTAWSSKFWGMLPLVNFIQFPWRLTLFLVILALPLVAWTASLNHWLRKLLLSLFLIQLVAIWRLQPADQLHKEVIAYDLFSQSTSTLNENLPKTFSYQEIADWAPEPKILTGEGSYTVEHWTGTNKKFKLSATTQLVMVEPTMYFTGWQTTANNQSIDYLPMEVTQGRIGYMLAPGEYQIETSFTQHTWPRLVGNSLSLLAIGLWAWLVWQEKPQLLKRS